MWKIRATYKNQLTYYEEAAEIPAKTIHDIKDDLEDNVIDDEKKNNHIVLEVSWVDTDWV